MTRLSVNLNKVALLRNARPLGVPSVTHFAAVAIEAGAQGITVHPRPDQRHIRGSDIDELSELLAAHPHIEFNIEGNPFHGLCEIAHRVRPHQCTLVPDEESAATSDHGWNLARDGARLRPLIQELKDLGIRVSLFIDPDAEAMQIARELGADRIELYTEPYARAFDAGDPKASLDLYSRAARSATDSGLGLNAGHDLNQANLPVFLAAVPGILEVSIGHALIADALEAGFAQTVRNYLSAIARGAAT
jgi:pyridoxine 5-phosphate synthase